MGMKCRHFFSGFSLEENAGRRGRRRGRGGLYVAPQRSMGG